jgi:hypothetical protein
MDEEVENHPASMVQGSGVIFTPTILIRGGTIRVAHTFIALTS